MVKVNADPAVTDLSPMGFRTGERLTFTTVIEIDTEELSCPSETENTIFEYVPA